MARTSGKQGGNQAPLRMDRFKPAQWILLARYSNNLTWLNLRSEFGKDIAEASSHVIYLTALDAKLGEHRAGEETKARAKKFVLREGFDVVLKTAETFLEKTEGFHVEEYSDLLQGHTKKILAFAEALGVEITRPLENRFKGYLDRTATSGDGSKDEEEAVNADIGSIIPQHARIRTRTPTPDPDPTTAVDHIAVPATILRVTKLSQAQLFPWPIRRLSDYVVMNVRLNRALEAMAKWARRTLDKQLDVSFEKFRKTLETAMKDAVDLGVIRHSEELFAKIEDGVVTCFVEMEEMGVFYVVEQRIEEADAGEGHANGELAGKELTGEDLTGQEHAEKEDAGQEHTKGDASDEVLSPDSTPSTEATGVTSPPE